MSDNDVNKNTEPTPTEDRSEKELAQTTGGASGGLLTSKIDGIKDESAALSEGELAKAVGGAVDNFLWFPGAVVETEKK